MPFKVGDKVIDLGVTHARYKGDKGVVHSIHGDGSPRVLWTVIEGIDQKAAGHPPCIMYSSPLNLKLVNKPTIIVVTNERKQTHGEEERT